ncbi:MAG: Zn-ribbon domain-containing OB-fold protein [Pseudomonadota bacterium]
MTEKPVPTIYPETQHFWDGAAAGKLLLQYCRDCRKHYFPPRPFCPYCGSRAVEIVEASGRGRLYSYTISHLPTPGYEPPFIVAVVMLEEGVKMLTNIVDCPQTPQAVALDMALEVAFEARGDLFVPQFRPLRALS